MTEHEHKWKFLRTERRYKEGFFGDQLDKYTIIYKVCSASECFATSRNSIWGYWYDKDFAGK